MGHTRAVPVGRTYGWLLTALLVLALAGCGAPAVAAPPTAPPSAPPAVTASPTSLPNQSPAPTRTPTPSPTAAPRPTPAALGADWPKIKPNELGRIMILEYHMLGPEEDRWTRSFDNFWHDLETLYAKGYRPIGLNDLADNKITTAAGFSPVVLTFDDSSPLQFAFLPGPAGEPIIDPQSAVGMLERFHRLHPDFPLKATFFVLPGADPPHDLFGQKDLKERKLRYLVERGFEIGNHTFWHQRLDTLTGSAAVSEQLGKAAKVIATALPGYHMRTLALPLGLFPENEAWAREGTYEGTPYKHEIVLLATGGTTAAPNHEEYDPLHMPRIQATNMELDFEEAYIGFYDRNPDKRYVSDGNPDLVVFPQGVASSYAADPHFSEVQLPTDLGREYRAIRLR